eukprot:CAMPEP_0202911272 /NCGR_PEP_ID=MMETSP1392-20130828/54491_1 /ASSEMBLY_ACC=CAM_ASM_000868 /TAXON_ID=225041 /ORGANISM="Chlamydomonas chlamydogama, Strain SAG 11-48b" /LENGTH=44 /DNA_ID=CAMNT_0049601713 /DNA_START=1287 /DNA_END=1421 /DNA_ORIENTATION=+
MTPTLECETTTEYAECPVERAVQDLAAPCDDYNTIDKGDGRKAK